MTLKQMQPQDEKRIEKILVSKKWVKKQVYRDGHVSHLVVRKVTQAQTNVTETNKVF